MRYEIVKHNSLEWDNILKVFEDASIYQTIAFSKSSLGGNNLEQFLVYEGDKIIAAAIVRIKILPLLNRGLAYIRWGPLTNLSEETLEEALSLLKREYVIRRKLFLRILSQDYSDNSNISNIFKSHNFKSIVINLKNDLDELKVKMRKKWRYNLKRAQKNDLVIDIGNSDNDFDIFYKIYEEMHSRKQFDEFVDVQTFKEINSELSEEMKMRIFICLQDNVPISSIVVSVIGNRGIYLLGGSTEAGRKTGASYLLQWEAMMWLKSKGITFYDLGGIDKEKNPGVYTFKAGMGGQEISFPGGFQSCNNLMSKLIVKIGELLN